MMITFGPEELFSEGRERLPRVWQLAKQGRESDFEPEQPHHHQGHHDHAGMQNASMVRLLATDQESLSVSMRSAQRLQFLALQVVVDKVMTPEFRDKLGFESDLAGILADLIGHGDSKNDDDGESASPPKKRRIDKEVRAKPPDVLLEFQRIMRNTVFFSPYLKYEIHFRIINCTITRERISELNPHFYTTSSASYDGVMTAADGNKIYFLTKLTRDVDRESATADVTFFGLPSAGLVKECVRHIFFKMTENENMLKADHVLQAFYSRLDCLPRRSHAMKDFYEFSANFPRTSAREVSWDSYVERTLAWCDRLMADTDLIRSSRRDIAKAMPSLRPNVTVCYPLEELRTTGSRTKVGMTKYRQANFVPDPYFTGMDFPY